MSVHVPGPEISRLAWEHSGEVWAFEGGEEESRMTSLHRKSCFYSQCSPRHCFRAERKIAGRFHPIHKWDARTSAAKASCRPLLAAMASPLAEYEVCLGFDSPLITLGGNLLNASNDHMLISLSPAVSLLPPLMGHASLLGCLPKHPG